MSPDSPRWFSHHDEDGRRTYARRFTDIADQGGDIDGEARFIDAMAGRGSTILDAGCGSGRVAAALARSGHRACGVDVDPILIDRGRELYDVPLAVLDLVEADSASLSAAGLPVAYDVVVCAGNVMLFAAKGSQPRIVENLAALLAPGGRVAWGFRTQQDFDHDDLDAAARRAGLIRQHRFADWELRPSSPGDDFAVSVYASRPT